MNQVIRKTLLASLSAVFAAATAEAAWTYDASAKTLTDGTWTFEKVSKVTVDGVAGLSLGGAITGSVDEIDFTSAPTDATCGFPVVKIDTAFSSVAVKRLIAPDLLNISKTFTGNKTIEEITVSPNISWIGKAGDTRYFEGCTSLRKFTPTAMPKVTALGKRLFCSCTNLTGGFVFEGVTNIVGDAPYIFSGSAITSLSMPNLTAESGGHFCDGCTSLTNFYAPKCTKLSSPDFSGCTALKSVTLSEDLESFPGNVFSGCSALIDLIPREFPLLTSVGSSAFDKCSLLRGKLSLPIATNSSVKSFSTCGFDEIYVPSMNVFDKYCLSGSPNLAKVTLSSLRLASGAQGNQMIKDVNANGNYKFDLYWTGTEIPTSFSDHWLHPNSNCGKIEDADVRIWVKPAVWAAWTNQVTSGITLAANLTAAQKASAYYPGDADTLGAIAKSYSYAWFCSWVNKTQATIECPSGVEVAKVVQNGATIAAVEGKYPLNPDLTVDITYRATGINLFPDGQTTYTVTGVAVAETIPASTCDKEVVAAEASAGTNRYLTVQAAFDVGGSVALLKDVEIASALAVAEGATVELKLGGRDIAAEETTFDNAGTLCVIGEGNVGGSAFAGPGKYKLKGGTYRFDVSAYCAGGFVATPQGTDPETWKVAQSTDVTEVLVDLDALAAAHVAAVRLVFDGDVPCVTNGATVVWTVAKNAAFQLVYTVAESETVNYRFANRGKTVTVDYPMGVAAQTVVTEIPATVAHTKWLKPEPTWDAAYLEDATGTWKLKIYCYHSVILQTLTSTAGKSYQGYTITGWVSGSGTLDLITCKEDTGYGVVSIGSSAFGGNASVTSLLAPDVVVLCNSCFRGGNTAIETVEVSPELYRLEQRLFQETKHLTTFTPSYLPELEVCGLPGKLDGEPGPFAISSTTLTGDFYFGKVTALPMNCFSSSYGAAQITSFSAPLVTAIYSGAFKNCKALETVDVPLATNFVGAVFSGCSAIKHIAFDAENTVSIGGAAFSGLNAVTNFPTSFPNLTYLGTDGFEGCNFVGDVSIPKVPILDEAFKACVNLTSVDASSCTNYGHYTFYKCTALTNVIVKGGRDCFAGKCPYTGKIHGDDFNGCTALKTVHWLSEEAPTNLATMCFSHSLNADATYEPPILYVNGDGDLSAWKKLCSTVKDDFGDAHRAIANYASLKKRYIIGFLGSPNMYKGELSVIYPSSGCINWVLKNPGPPRGLMMLITD